MRRARSRPGSGAAARLGGRSREADRPQAAGGGIALLPTFYLGDELRCGALKPVLCKFAAQELAVYALYPERRNLMPKVRAFVDFLAATFGHEPPWEKGWVLED
jgi:DNA-binding transcriptional LysR family regulator